MGIKKKIKTGNGQACGKLILFGEHSVVYGYPCIVIPVNKKIKVKASIISDYGKDIIITNNGDPKFVKQALEVFRQEFFKKHNYRLVINTGISDQYGFGSSSAVTAATIRALADLYQYKLTDKQFFSLCYRIILNIQKVGSGADIAEAVYNKTIYYENFGKIIEPIDNAKLNIVVGYTGIKADTVKLIQNLKHKMKNENSKFQIFKIFDQITNIINKARYALKKNDYQLIGELMIQNHRLLKELGVSIAKLDNMVDEAVKAGAYGAKLSGAGGGDCMIALVNNRTKNWVKKAIEQVGGEIINIF